jgi:hypothetical protein
MFFPSDSVSIQGDLKSFDMPGGSGHILHRRFCPTCGSGVFVQSAARPGSIAVMAGTLDDPTMFARRWKYFATALSLGFMPLPNGNDFPRCRADTAGFRGNRPADAIPTFIMGRRSHRSLAAEYARKPQGVVPLGTVPYPFRSRCVILRCTA